MGEEELPFSNLDAINEVSNPKLRFSHKNVIRVAENEKDKGRYEESVDLYKTVSEFLNSEAYRLVMQNIETLLKLNAQQKDKENDLNNKNLKDFSSNNIPGINISIDNINLSGIELNGGQEAFELVRELFEKKLSDLEIPTPKNDNEPNSSEKSSNSKDSPSDNVEDSKKSNTPEEKTTQENPSKGSQHSDNENKYHSSSPFDFSKLPFEEIKKLLPLLSSGADSDIQEILNRVKNLETLVQDKNEYKSKESPNIQNSQTNEDLQKPIQNNTAESEQDQNKQENPFAMQLDQKKDSEPIKIQQVGATKKIKKLKAVSLTYDFSNMFHNKYYFKFEDMFKEAGRLVNAKKLDEAIDIYNVLLDQKLPETMKMMIKQNVIDLKESIINTFKYSNTFFKVDESGNAVAVGETEDSISVISQDHSKNDVYFKE